MTRERVMHSYDGERGERREAENMGGMSRRESGVRRRTRWGEGRTARR